MDGVFVPNISFGFPILEVVARITDKFLDVHLMTSRPEAFIDDFARAGANGLTVHVEVVDHLHACCQRIRAAGMRAGVALNPATPVSAARGNPPRDRSGPGDDRQSGLRRPILHSGHDGQDRAHAGAGVERVNPHVLIQVDGGVKVGNAPDVVAAGADVLVSGSGVFGAEDPTAAISALKHIQRDTQPV